MGKKKFKCELYTNEDNCPTQGACSECGWNPKVHAERVDELRRKAIQGERIHVSVQKRDSRSL